MTEIYLNEFYYDNESLKNELKNKCNNSHQDKLKNENNTNNNTLKNYSSQSYTNNYIPGLKQHHHKKSSNPSFHETTLSVPIPISDDSTKKSITKKTHGDHGRTNSDDKSKYPARFSSRFNEITYGSRVRGSSVGSNSSHKKSSTNNNNTNNINNSNLLYSTSNNTKPIALTKKYEVISIEEATAAGSVNSISSRKFNKNGSSSSSSITSSMTSNSGSGSHHHTKETTKTWKNEELNLKKEYSENGMIYLFNSFYNYYYLLLYQPIYKKTIYN